MLNNKKMQSQNTAKENIKEMDKDISEMIFIYINGFNDFL